MVLTLPPVDEWKQRPLLLRASPKADAMASPGPGATAEVNTHESYPFETPLFKGRFHLAVRYANASECDPWAEGMWMHKKERKVSLWVQGEFKERLRFDDVYLGFVWDRPLAPPRGVGTVMNLCEYFSPGAIHDILSDTEPYVLNMMAGGADHVHMWREGEPESDRLDPHRPSLVPERNAGGMPEFTSMKQRAKWMNKKHKDGGINASHYHFEPGWTYTFDFYTHTMLLNDFQLHVPLPGTKWKVNLEDYLNGQHYPFVARTKCGRVLWSFELWHEKTAVKEIEGKNAWQRFEEQVAELLRVQGAAEASPTHADSISERIDLSMSMSLQAASQRNPSADDDDGDEDTMSAWSCESGSDAAAENLATLYSPGGVPSDDEESAESGEGKSPASKPLAAPAPEKSNGKGKGKAKGSPTGHLRASQPKQGETRVMLWSGKRLRAKPKHSGSWVTKKNDIPQGCAVVIVSLKDQWAEVKLPNGVKGWTPGRNLGSQFNKPFPEPQVAVITGRRKRVRAEPKSKAKRHGPYLQQDEEVDVLTQTDGWVLVCPTMRPAGWVKMSNVKLLGEGDL